MRTLAPSSRIKSILKRLRSVFTTPQTRMDSAPSIAAVSDENTSIIGFSESRGEIVHPDVSPTSEDEDHPGSSSYIQSDLSPASVVDSSNINPVNEQSTSDCDSILDDDDYYARNYRDHWVSESTRQEGQELITYSRASFSLESPSPHSLRPDKWKHPSRFQSNDPTPVKDP